MPSNPSPMHRDSWNAWLASFDLGERRYLETSLESYPAMMRVANTPKSRRPQEMEGMEFTSTLFTAISAAQAGETRYLICVERTA